jgi:hypothetical protein
MPSNGPAATVVISPGDAPVVHIAAAALASDVEAVTGKPLTVLDSAKQAQGLLLLVGTIGHSTFIDDLRRRKLIDTSGIEGRWETFEIRTVAHPLPGVESALVIAGSDPRGTAYGIFDISRQIGVSPWIWWADVPPPHQAALYLTAPDKTSTTPSVQYRGIFLNDEDFALRVWAGRTQDTEMQNIGPKTYAHIFELLLRLRANTLWPAMHPGTRTFNASPENAKLATENGIVMGSSHAEPMMRNNVSEWDPKQRGEWDYEHNKSAVLQYWDERATANGTYENIYSMGMRGIHDSAMPGSGTPAEKAKLLEKILADQRRILAQRVNPQLEQIPQVFWMYKEVLELYRAGMTIPPDITLGWTDDNYGYIRQLSDTTERKRIGGSGVYYHVSYWGAPHDYLWLCTTPPELMREELTKAYDYGAHKIWILNVGDLKPAEVDIDYFMQLAWDEPGVSVQSQSEFLTNWAATQFPAEFAPRIAALLANYYQLNFDRKPEFMGFNTNSAAVRRTAFNPIAFGDQNATRRRAFDDLRLKAEQIGHDLPPAYDDAFFELALYPVTAAALMNDKALLTDDAALASAQGRPTTSTLINAANQAYSEIQQQTALWDTMRGGKWNGMMSANPHGLPVFKAPLPVGGKVPDHGALGVAVEGSAKPLHSKNDAPEHLAEGAKWTSNPPAGAVELPTFTHNAAGQTRFIDLFSTFQGDARWQAVASVDWIKLDSSAGMASATRDERLLVSVDWTKLQTTNATGTIEINSGEQKYSVPVTADARASASGIFTQNEGSVSIGATHTSRRVGAHWEAFIGLSPLGDAVGVPDRASNAAASATSFSPASPRLEYQFETSEDSKATIRILTLPTFTTNAERRSRYAISVDHAPPIVIDAAAASPWEENVLRNSAVSTATLGSLLAGRHTLKFWYVDPGVMVQHFVIQIAPGPLAYPVPPETLTP